YWELSNRFPVAHWVYKAEKTFGSYDFFHENMPKPTPSNKRRITSSGVSTVKKFKNNLADVYDSNEEDEEKKRMDKIIEQLLFQNAKDQQVAPRSLIPYSVVPMEIYANDIEFGDSLSSIQNGLNNWKARNVVLLNLECNIEYVKWKHFLNLNLAYRALKRVVNQMPPEGNKTTIKYKIQNKIPIGKNSSKKSKRSWISYQMQSMLHIDKRAERRIWTALR
ncbi:13786_t:CDS:2, partial [Gigaspora rosea]